MSARKKKKQEKLEEALRRRRSKGGHLSSRPQEGGPVSTPTPPGVEKMSEVLWGFVEPYLETTHDEKGIRNLLDLALLVWSIPLLKPDEQEGILRDTLQAVPVDLRPALTVILAHMVQRRQNVFGDNKRTILSYELRFTPDGPHLDVVSTFPVS